MTHRLLNTPPTRGSRACTARFCTMSSAGCRGAPINETSPFLPTVRLTGPPASPPGLGVGGPSGLGTDGPSGLGTDGPSGLGTDGPSGAIIPEVTGLAHATGTHVFRLDPHDELDTGFVLR